ncbi:MAG TPA: hypothetical protein VFZ00_09350, partial [Solirubrobacter sp.]|nr:hypothetical protein [Solirubrobacter sp.]
PATGKAADADKLDGKDATEFLASTKVQAAGPVVLDMHPLNNATVNTPIATFGSYVLHALCSNVGGAPVARVGIASSVEFFLEVGEAASRSISPRAASATIHTLLSATPSGGTQWDSASTTFSAIANPAAGSGAIQGAATVIASNPAAGKRCYVSAWAVTS